MLDGSREKDPYTTPVQPLSFLYSPGLCVSCTVYLYIERCSIIFRLVEWGKKTKFHLWHFSLVPIMGPATLLETTSSFFFHSLSSPSSIPLLPAQHKDGLCKLPSKPSNRQRIIHHRLRIDHSLILSFQLPRSATTTLFRCLRPFSRRKNPESVCANLRRTSRASSPFQTPFPFPIRVN